MTNATVSPRSSLPPTRARAYVWEGMVTWLHGYVRYICLKKLHIPVTIGATAAFAWLRPGGANKQFAWGPA